MVSETTYKQGGEAARNGAPFDSNPYKMLNARRVWGSQFRAEVEQCHVEAIAEDIIRSGSRGVEPPRLLTEIEATEISVAVTPGIYFLVHCGEIVYAGQSLKPSGRISDHSKNKIFDRAFVIDVPRHKLNDVEGAFIRALAPHYNGGAGRCAAPNAPGNPANDASVLSDYAPTLLRGLS